LTAPWLVAAPDQPCGMQALLSKKRLQILFGPQWRSQDVAPGAQSQLQTKRLKRQHSFSGAPRLKVNIQSTAFDRRKQVIDEDNALLSVVGNLVFGRPINE